MICRGCTRAVCRACDEYVVRDGQCNECIEKSTCRCGSRGVLCEECEDNPQCPACGLQTCEMCIGIMICSTCAVNNHDHKCTICKVGKAARSCANCMNFACNICSRIPYCRECSEAGETNPNDYLAGVVCVQVRSKMYLLTARALLSSEQDPVHGL